MTVYVDTRWDGHKGIARYAREVTSRLATPTAPWRSRIGPTSPADTLAPARLLLRRDDLLYSPGFATGVARCRQLVTLHDLIHLSGAGVRVRLNRAFYDRVVRPAILRSGHVLTVSRASGDAIAAWLDDERVRIHVTGEGTSDVFTPDGQVAQFDRPYFLYVGNMRPHKNPQVFFDAVAGLPDHRAVVVTSDPHEAHAAATRARVTDRTSVLSDIDDHRLASLYRGAQALVFPSLEEGFGLPPLEAVRSGCPVVHFAGCAAVSELCGDSGPGAVSSATDAAAWRTAMLAADGPDEKLMAAGARHTWQGAAATVDEVLRELTDG